MFFKNETVLLPDGRNCLELLGAASHRTPIALFIVGQAGFLDPRNAYEWALLNGGEVKQERIVVGHGTPYGWASEQRKPMKGFTEQLKDLGGVFIADQESSATCWEMKDHQTQLQLAFIRNEPTPRFEIVKRQPTAPSTLQQPTQVQIKHFGSAKDFLDSPEYREWAGRDWMDEL